MVPSYKISDEAYLTTITHLCKYSSSVSGLYLGTNTSDQITLQKALPIAHSSLVIGTTPVTEMALHIAEQQALQSDQQIVGVYFANENADDTSIPTFPTRLADRIRSHFPHACLLMLNPPALTPTRRKKEHCFRLCVRDAQQATWAKGVRPPADLVVSESALQIADQLFSGKGSVYDMADFEDHCLDPRQDWFNSDIESSWSHLQSAT